jgi:ABC-type branched-subunit amino acid transport system substrate-binding protein
VAAVAATALVAGCSGGSGGGSASAPGVTGSQITLGSTQPLTGPAAPGYGEIGPAIDAAFHYINAKGGVHGRKLVFKYQDDGYDPTRTAQLTRQLVLQSRVFGIVGGLGTAPQQAVAPYLAAQKVPDLFVDTGCPCFNAPAKYPQTFGSIPDYIVEGKILGSYLKQHFAGQKIAFIGQDDDLGNFGYQGLHSVLPVASRQSYDPNTLTSGLGNQISAAKAAGAKVIVSFSIPAATALEVLAEAEIGYHPQMVVSEVGSDPTALNGLLASYSKGKANGSLDNGMITTGYLASTTDTANAWTALAKKVHDRYDAKAPFDGFFLNGFEVAMLTYDAFQAAGSKPTRQNVVSAIESQGNRFAGPWLAPLGFSAKDHDAALGMRVGTLQSNQLTLSGPIYTATAGSPVTTYAGAQSAIPAALK